MKKFTDTQKKWALTATMIAALGCSVSFNPHTNGYAALDFASTSSDVVTKKLKLDDQVLKVHYIPTGKKTTAVVTGGSDCVVCNTYVIDKKLKDDADTLTDIQVELVQQIAAKQDGEEVEESEDSERVSERSEREEELAEKRKERAERAEEARKDKLNAKKDYKKIEDKMKLAYCGPDELEPGDDRASCLTNEFLSILDSDKVYSKKAVFDYFSRKLQPKLLEQLLDTSTVEPGNPYSPKQANRALSAIKDLMSGLPSDYNTTRESLVYLASQSIHASASLQQDYLNNFATTGSPEAKTNAISQQIWTDSLINNLKQVISPYAIRSGLAAGTISQAQANAIFQNNFELYANSVKAGTSLWTVKGQPVNLGAYTLPEPQYANVLGLQGVQSEVVQGQPAPDLSTRILVVERGANGNGAIPILQSNTPNIQFGQTLNQVDPRVQQQLLELRASPNYHRAQ